METLRMKRSLDLDGLHEALPTTCRAVCMGGMYSERQLAKRTRHGDTASALSSWAGSPSASSRHGHTSESDPLSESIFTPVQADRVLSASSPHPDRHDATTCNSSDNSSDPFRAARDVNPFPIRGPPLSEELDVIVSGLSPLRKKMFSSSTDNVQASDGDDMRETSQLSQAVHSNGEKLYTHEELRAVVNKALSIQGASLRSEYNGILQSKLAEQFQSFTKFNQDYISRQIKGSPFSYVS